MKTLNVGVIGCGAIGKAHIRRLIERVPGAEVCGVTDFVPAAAADIANQYGLRCFDSAEALINDPETEAVLIASSDPSHAGYVLSCIEARKPVLCEKPLALTAADCERILAAEQAAGQRFVQVGFMRRYDPGYQEIKRTIDEGTLGAPLLIHACHRNVYQPDTFQTDMAITNVAIHELDISRWLMNDEYDCAQVLSVRQNSHTNGDYLNPQLVLLKTRAGARIVVEVQSSCAYAYDIRCEVVGETGTVSLPDPPRATCRTQAACTTPLMTDWSQRFIEAYEIELQAWVSAVLEGRAEGPSAWDGYAACVTADALIRSRRTGNPEPVCLIEKPTIYR